MCRSTVLPCVLALSLLPACGGPEPAEPPPQGPGPDQQAAEPAGPVLRDLEGTWEELRAQLGTPSDSEEPELSEGEIAYEYSLDANADPAPRPEGAPAAAPPPAAGAAMPGPSSPPRRSGGGGHGGAYTGPGEEVPADALGDLGYDYRALGENAVSGDDDYFLEGEPSWSSEELAEDAPNEQRTESWKPEAKRPNATAIRVGDGEELPLLGVQASTWVAAHRARVVLDLFYFNDREEQLEGEFVLRLPEGASPYYLAFGGQTEWRADRGGEAIGDFFLEPPAEDVPPRRHSPDGIRMDREGQWIQPKEARVVPREKAAHAYTETVRRQVDPALLEWAGAGVFRARVFPLLPGELHRVVIGYELDLTRVGSDWEYVLELPEEVAQVAVDLSIAAPEGVELEVEPAGPAWGGGPWRDYSWRDPAERTFRVRLVEPGPIALRSGGAGGEDHFALAFEPAAHWEVDGSGQGRAVFVLDTSLSSSPDRFPIWLALLEEILTANRQTVREFAVLEADVERHWWRGGFTPNTPADVAAFLDHASGIALEGATDLAGALAEAARPSWGASGEEWDLFLLSDSAPTWGEDDVWTLSRALEGGGADALFGYSTGMAGTDRRVLDHLARETGGAVFTVGGAADVPAAAVAHRARPYRIEGVRVAGARDLLLKGRPGALYPGQLLTLVGRGAPAVGAEIELDVERNGIVQTLRQRVVHGVDSDLATRAFGEVAVAQLEELGRALEAEARAFATHFRVPGATCSLLMLETEEDYERFEIVPEDDAGVVAATDTAQLVAETLRSHADALGDPRRAFLAHVARLEGMPGLELEVPEALEAVFSDLSADTFVVTPEPLRSASRAAADLPAELAEALSAGEPEYDALQAEAAARLESRGAADSLRLVSSLVELHPGDGVAARDVAFTAMELGFPGHAYHLLRRVASSRPWEPQTYHAMARCLERAGNPALALAWYEVALLGKWDARFGEFREIVSVDYLHFLRGLDTSGMDPVVSAYAATRFGALSEVVQPPRADLLVTIAWNTDATDVDLHVIEPTGEECYYSHPDTAIGGHLTKDVTQGYGPEMYVLATAAPGEYAIGAHYYSSNPNRAGVRSKVHTVVYVGWGTPAEQRIEKVVTLVKTGDMHPIGVLALE